MKANNEYLNDNKRDIKIIYTKYIY